ncbi:hypothetical protein KIH41_03860 [Litoribacter ruber]|uniref:hypothetical protein n=1 Tax=Litoribacter ruber TaxID=702568 RepID=UPI001BD9547F|nr:hypothetical protein [Litoribacter ruber]MBT0810410.1 hypothetical protein [Litoribacter ruber]
MIRLHIILAILLFGFFSCNTDEEEIYTGRELQYQLFPGSEFDFSGVATVRELIRGGVELQIQLEGQKSNDIYYYPAHLHFGEASEAGANMAYMLNPVDARALLSITSFRYLTDGTEMNFERFSDFNGHIKIHLAEDGPEYQVILALGNVGSNT